MPNVFYVANNMTPAKGEAVGWQRMVMDLYIPWILLMLSLLFSTLNPIPMVRRCSCKKRTPFQTPYIDAKQEYVAHELRLQAHNALCLFALFFEAMLLGKLEG